jgi:CRP-like cAMP-binding protein
MPSSNNLTDKNLFKAYKILDLGKGDIFGEDKQFFNCPNRFTIKVTSIKTTILSISCANLAKYFNRVWEHMLE